jgi:hypothetical protein
MIRANVKRVVRSIYVMRCGYCGVTEAAAGAELTYDHFQPQTKGGSHRKDNIVYACHACNEFKGNYFGETEETRLLHPLRDDLTTHLRHETDGTLSGMTAAGERYIRILQLNRPPLVLRRKDELRLEESVTRYETIDARLDVIMERVQRIEEQLNSRRR